MNPWTVACGSQRASPREPILQVAAGHQRKCWPSQLRGGNDQSLPLRGRAKSCSCRCETIRHDSGRGRRPWSGLFLGLRIWRCLPSGKRGQGLHGVGGGLRRNIGRTLWSRQPLANGGRLGDCSVNSIEASGCGAWYRRISPRGSWTKLSGRATRGTFRPGLIVPLGGLPASLTSPLLCACMVFANKSWAGTGSGVLHWSPALLAVASHTCW